MEDFPNLDRSTPSIVIFAVITVSQLFCISTRLGLIQVGGRIYIHI